MFRNVFNSFSLNTKLLLQTRSYAARKGTREKAKKKKVKVEIKETVYIPKNLRERNKLVSHKETFLLEEQNKLEASDDVYILSDFKRILMPFQNAIDLHRETLHPTMFNVPNAPVTVKIQLDMSTEKKNKYIEGGLQFLSMPHKFENIQRKVVCFSKTDDDINQALKLGASLAGGIELIKQFESGQHSLHDYSHVIANPNILVELLCLKGLLKKRFPNFKAGNLGVNIKYMIEKFVFGIQYHLNRDETDKSYGWVNTTLGKLNMETSLLENNLKTLINDINEIPSKPKDNFITACMVHCEPSNEKILFDYNSFITKKVNKKEGEFEEE